MLAVFRKDLRILLRDRSAFVFSLLMPILVITVIAEGLFHGDDGPQLLVPVVNQDGGPVASTFIKLLGEHADVRPMSRAEAEHLVRDKHEAAAAIVFPPQLSKQYLQGRSSEILLLTDPLRGRCARPGRGRPAARGHLQATKRNTFPGERRKRR